MAIPTPEQARQLVEHFGSQRKAAAGVGVSQATISHWLDPAKWNARARKWRAENLDSARAASRKWRAANVEAARASRQRWAARPEVRARRNARERARRALDPEYRERRNAQVRGRYAALAASDYQQLLRQHARYYRTSRLAAIERAQGKSYAPESFPKLDVDRLLVPEQRGGT